MGFRAFKPSEAGFSLIELMVVVAIIGILSTMAIPSYKDFSDRAKYGKVKAELSGLQTTIVGMRLGASASGDNQILSQITGSTCSACGLASWGAGPVNINESTAASDPSWVKLGYPSTPKDPWGSPYILDENELEYGGADCRYDSVLSTGADLVSGTVGDGDDVYGDDYMLRIPYSVDRGCPNNILKQTGN